MTPTAWRSRIYRWIALSLWLQQMNRTKPNYRLLSLAALLACSAWLAATLLWLHVGRKAIALSLFLLGLSLGPCLAIYALVPIPHKLPARRVVLFTGGLSVLVFSFAASTNLELEGFFTLLFTATMGAAIGHTLVTLLVGPLLFGRFLCGWGCWRSMILELLPIKHSPGRRAGAWRFLPFLGLGASIAAAALSAFLFRLHPSGSPTASARSLAILFAIYYLASVGLAFALQDQRAFCKYLCPSGLILGLTSRLSLLKMSGHRPLCNACGACSQICPMDIDVARFVALGQRVASGQCILCQRCAQVCPTSALHLTAVLPAVK